MSNSHLLFQLPQCFITLLSKQGACFSSILISFPKWLLQFLLNCSSTYSFHTQDSIKSGSPDQQLFSLANPFQKSPSHQLGAKVSLLLPPRFPVIPACPNLLYVPRLLWQCICPQDHPLLISIWSLCLQFSRCQLDEFLMLLLTPCADTRVRHKCPETHQQHEQRSLQPSPSLTNRAGQGSGAEVF